MKTGDLSKPKVQPISKPRQAEVKPEQNGSHAAVKPKQNGLYTAATRPQNASTVAAVKLQHNGSTHNGTPRTAAPAKRGFASLLAKANAAQEAVKAAGPDMIRHKVAEGMKKKERERLKLEAKDKEKLARKAHISRSTVRNDKIGQPIRRPKDDLSKVGTMRARPATGTVQTNKQKGLGKDKYGGYASWSDLDAEDEEEDYESESDMEEAGFDDVMEEEEQAARIARQEDQKEQAEEERRRKEKMERKQKLMALSNSAAAKKRY